MGYPPTKTGLFVGPALRLRWQKYSNCKIAKGYRTRPRDLLLAAGIKNRRRELLSFACERLRMGYDVLLDAGPFGSLFFCLSFKHSSLHINRNAGLANTRIPRGRFDQVVRFLVFRDRNSTRVSERSFVFRQQLSDWASRFSQPIRSLQKASQSHQSSFLL
jgi:hypothetical protein